jgi:hypothetical protein
MGPGLGTHHSFSVSNGDRTGYTLKLLSWPEAGFTIGPKGVRKPIETSVLQYMHERKVDWMCFHQANDLTSLTSGKVRFEKAIEA